MHFYQYMKRPFRTLLFVIAGVLLCLTVLYTYSIPIYADDPPAPVSSTVTLSHTHRGDSSCQGECYTIPVFHQHHGDTASGGACYSPVYHTHSSSCYTTCAYHSVSTTFVSSENTYCNYHGPTEKVNYLVVVVHSVCGRIDHVNASVGCTACGGDPGNDCNGSHSILTCGNGGAITGYRMTCNKSVGETIDYYDPGCGLDVRSYGSMTLTNSTPGWTSGNVTLTGSLNDPEGVITDGGFGVMSFSAESGEIADTGSDHITVSDNGIYTMNITVDETRFDTASASVMLNVTNIDRTEPAIGSVDYDQGDNWLRRNDITITAADLQPDGTRGSGLADEAYSFDGGNTWQSSPVCTCEENGIIEILVRDQCDNTASTSIEITNIDNSGPDVSYLFTPSVWYQGEGSRTYTFTATDTGAGLPEYPFSYDGGETWTDEASLSTWSAGSFTVLIRDSLDNITELTLNSEYSIRPVIEPEEDDNSSDSSGNDPSENTDENAQPSYTIPDTDMTDNPGDDLSDSSGNSRETGTERLAYAVYDGMDGIDSSTSETVSDESDSVANEPSVYFEQLPGSSAAIDITRQDTVQDQTPFYRTRGFKAAASVGGGMLGAGSLLTIFLLLYSGVIIYSYDGDKYRLTGIRVIRRSERGNYIFLSRDFLDNAYSSRYKLKPGPVYVRRHADDLLSINADGDWISLNVERYIYTNL